MAIPEKINVPVEAELSEISGLSVAEAEKPVRISTPGSDLLDLDDLPAVVTDLIPPGWQRFTLNTDRLVDDLPNPRRSKGVVSVDSAADLVTAVEQRKTGPVALYADERNLKIVAVLNDDHGGTPGHRDYRVVAQLLRTPDYQAWLDGQGLHEQVEFAEFIEDHLTDILSPPAADMLELAQTFHARQSARFSSTQRLQSGRVSLNYEEDETVTAGGTRTIEIPTEFSISLCPFWGTERVKFTARLRYRVGRGTLQLGWQLTRPDEIESVIFSEQAALAADALGVPVINGFCR